MREQRDGLDAEEPAVDVVACGARDPRLARSQEELRERTEEEVVGVRRVAAYAEDLNEVVELAWVSVNLRLQAGKVRGAHPWMSPTTVTGARMVA